MTDLTVELEIENMERNAERYPYEETCNTRDTTKLQMYMRAGTCAKHRKTEKSAMPLFKLI